MIPATRFEYKILLTLAQRDALLTEFAGQLRPDTQGGPSGRYPVVSLYCDTPDLRCHWDAWRGLPVRRKLRVRVYGSADGAIAPTCFLEVKHKDGGEGAKRRVSLPLGEALRAAAGHDVSGLPTDGATLTEVARLVRLDGLRPTCVMRYDRHAFFLQDDLASEPLRVTFDLDVMVRFTDLTPRPDDRGCEQRLLPQGHCLMELKGATAVPYAFARALSCLGLYPRPFSKYSEAIRRYHPTAAHAA